MEQSSGRRALALAACGATGAAIALFVWRRRKSELGEPLQTLRLPVDLDRRRFGLSDLGFAPLAEDTLQRLPPAFDVWESAASNLPELTRSHQIRAVVDDWPPLDLRSLEVCDEFSPVLRRTYVILAFIAHSYVWCKEGEPRKSLPAALAVPFHLAATRLGLPPVLTSTGPDLWNEQLALRLDPALEVKNQSQVRCLTTMTGTKDEEWFYLSSHVIQRIAGPAVLAGYDLLAKGVPQADYEAVGDFLSDCAERLVAMTAAMRRLSNHCAPAVFYNILRPLLRGFGPATPLTEGLIYNGVAEYNGRPQSFAGASAAQSCAVPFLDAVLGVAHGEREAAFLQEMRRYMPARHRDFLVLIQAQPSLRQSLLKWRTGSGPGPACLESVIQKYNTCIDNLAEFRRSHWKLVGTHILAPARAFADSAAGAKGTGGSSLEDFLGGTVRSTLAAKI